jgi:hypothetical protein
MNATSVTPVTRITGAPVSDFARFLRHCARFRLISPKTYPRGVFKFRDLSEAQAARAHHDSLKTRRAENADRGGVEQAPAPSRLKDFPPPQPR